MPQEVHRIVEQMRTARDEELLDLVRETVAQLNKLGDRLESYITSDEGDSNEEAGEDAIAEADS